MYDHMLFHSSVSLQPGECPVVLEVSTHQGEVNNAALPVQGIVPDAASKPQSYSAGDLCFW